MNLLFTFRKLICFLFIVFVLAGTFTVSAQSLKLVIGKYDCFEDSDCNNGYCDINTHECVRCYGDQIMINQECTCPEGTYTYGNSCIECDEQSEVWNGVNGCFCNEANDYHLINGICQLCPDKQIWNGQECICALTKEICSAGVDTQNCLCCPAEKPIWNGKNCESCGNDMYADNGICCPIGQHNENGICVCGEKETMCNNSCCRQNQTCQNGYCVGYCSHFDETINDNVCRLCNETNGLISNKENGTLCQVSFSPNTGTCLNGTCKIPCTTQSDCGGTPSSHYCHYVFSEKNATNYSCLKPAGHEGYCVSRNLETRSVLSLEKITNYRLSIRTMNAFDAENYCASWGMRQPKYNDFGCYYVHRGVCYKPVLAELKGVYGTPYVWVGDTPVGGGNCQHKVIRFDGWMDTSSDGIGMQYAMCIKNDSLDIEVDACYNLISSDCAWCDRTGEEAVIVYAEDNTECSIEDNLGGICKSGICEAVGDGCNTNDECKTDFYCHYQKFDSSNKPIAKENGYKGICRLVVKRPVLTELKSTDKSDGNRQYGNFASVETSNYQMDYWSAQNFCKAIGKTQQGNHSGVIDRWVYLAWTDAFYDKFHLGVFWCGPTCGVGSIHYVSPATVPTNTSFPYCL